MPKFGLKSKQNHATCHPLLQEIADIVVKNFDCSFLWGFRSQVIIKSDPLTPRRRPSQDRSRDRVERILEATAVAALLVVSALLSVILHGQLTHRMQVARADLRIAPGKSWVRFSMASSGIASAIRERTALTKSSKMVLAS